MSIRKAGIQEFLTLAQQALVLDVRSPGEYTHAHIPGTHSLPLFSDEERKVVGTAYKQQSREDAIKIGLGYFGVKMRGMVEQVELLLKERPATGEGPNTLATNTVLVHCWRGGMRSAGMAWLLDLYGFNVYTLVGGYKAFRQWVLQQFSVPCPVNIVGGYTGSGKTYILHELKRSGELILDLEHIAQHKGSAFGGFGVQQPTQEMFENCLAVELEKAGKQAEGDRRIWVEDESQRIGQLNLPVDLWNTMRTAPVYFVDVPFEERLQHIVDEYGGYSKEELVNAVIRITKRLGGQDTKNAINFLVENDHKESFRILLKYYDKFYKRGIEQRDKDVVVTSIYAEKVDAKINSTRLIAANQS